MRVLETVLLKIAKAETIIIWRLSVSESHLIWGMNDYFQK